MKTLRVVGLIAAVTVVGAIAAAAADPAQLDGDVRDATQRFQQASPRIQRLFNEAYGYAIFPSVGKGAIGIGGAEGRGQVFEKGNLVGTAKLIQGTVGAQLGAQSYSEVIFFESEKALDEFKDGKTAISASLSAAAAADGAGAEAKYQHGALVYTMQRSGLMFEASIGGQHFAFTYLSSGTPPPAPLQTTPPASLPPTTPPASTEPPPASQTPQPSSPTPDQGGVQ
jgi:lipid-binding SYLF domain-containing protein